MRSWSPREAHERGGGSWSMCPGPMVYGMRGCRVEPPGCVMTEQRCAWHQRMPSRRSLPQWHLVGRSWREAHHDHGLAQLLHALDHARGAWRLPIPERQEHVACLRHLEVAAHASAFPKPLPVGTEELMPDG